MKSPKPPVSQPPVTMPVPDQTEVNAVKKKNLLAASARSGRQSTILSQTNNAANTPQTLG